MPRLSFSLRDVFWLTVVVGMGVGWLIQHQHANKELSVAKNRLAALEFVLTTAGAELKEDGTLAGTINGVTFSSGP